MARIELRFGTPVTDGHQEYGSLSGVTLEDYGLHWQTLAVRRGGLIHSDAIVPREAMLEADTTRIIIARAPVEGASPEARTIHGNCAVRAEGDDTYGRVVGLLTSQDGRLLFIVIQHRPLAEPTMAPAEALAAVQPDAVILDSSPAQIETLPLYRADTDLTYDARQNLQGLGPIASDDVSHMHVEAVDGTLILTGHISFRSRATWLEDELKKIPGVLGVINRLVCDDELESEVGSVLPAIPHTGAYSVTGRVHQGVVELIGHAEDRATAEAATEMVAKIPMVRGIVNRVEAPGFATDPDWMDPPAVGENVYAEDGLLGRVDRVVIDPRRRSFTGLIVDVALPAGDDPYVALAHRTVFLPRTAIRACTDTSVFLLQTLSDATENPPAAGLAVPPAADWQPPFPYRPEGVAWPEAAVHSTTLA